jgi:hypothetical protein
VGEVIEILQHLRAPKRTYAEISIALAEKVLPVFEKEFPKDLRPRQAVEATKACLKDQTPAVVQAAVNAANGANDASIASTMHAAASNAASAASNAAWTGADGADGAGVGGAMWAAVDTANTAAYAINAGLTKQHALNIIQEIGEKYFSFLAQWVRNPKAEKVAEADETLDPAKFVKSYTTTKYKNEIERWNKVSTTGDALAILQFLRAPKVAYTEISITLAEEVLPKFEKKYPKDLRPRKAIEAAKAWTKSQTSANVQAATFAADAAYNASVATFANAAMAASNAALAASNAAAQAGADTTERAAINAANAAYNAISAGLTKQHALGVIKGIGEKYFSFLIRGWGKHTSEKVAEADETLDPAEFVQSFTVAKYKDEIERWTKSPTVGTLIGVLKAIKTSKAVFVEIGIAIAEEALSVFENKHPGDLQDLRPRKALEIAKPGLRIKRKLMLRLLSM